MGIRFNADEVLTMAVKVEENGEAFYRKAAGFQGEGEIKSFLIGLAEMEQGHKKTFAEMRTGLSEREAEVREADPDGEAQLYLNALADFHGGEGAPSAADSLTGNESLDDILTIALDLEKKSILYYLGLIDMVPPTLGKDKVSAIIAEERKHVVQLTERRRQIRGAA